MQLLTIPLTETDLDELQELLASNDETSVDVESPPIYAVDVLHGFLAAVLSRPGIVMPGECMGIVFGDREWESMAQAGRAMNLLMQFWNEINSALQDGTFAPLVMNADSESDEPVADAAGWCRGYVRGLSVYHEEWAASLENEELGRLITPIVALAAPDLNTTMRELVDEYHDGLIDRLSDCANGLFALMRGDRVADSDFPIIPSFDDSELAALDTAGLLDLMIENEDRVPRNLVDECARRGAEIVNLLSDICRNPDFWRGDVEQGEWWLRLHTVMILGLIPDAGAGELLVDCMRRMSNANDDDLQDWLAGYWAALFSNKPDGIDMRLRTLCEDRELDHYIRSTALQPVIARAHRRDAAAFTEALDWLASNAADEDEDWYTRLAAADTLLDFPQARYRELLDKLAARQTDFVRFSEQNVEEAYAQEACGEPEWERLSDPWEFYQPAAIHLRQIRWAREGAGMDARQNGQPLLSAHGFGETYVRATPKIGRNDPCSCGSGKKYKKCCARTAD